MTSKKKSVLWLTHATLATQNKKRDVMRGHLRIENGIITEITREYPSALSRKTQNNTKVVSCEGLVLLPGFVQTHVHLCQTLFRNQADDLELLDWLKKKIWVYEAGHTPETLKKSAEIGIRELLSGGTTCILDMGTVRHTESIFEAARDLGIRANIGKCLMDNPATCPKNLHETTEKALTEALDLYSLWNGSENDRLRASLAPRFAISCTDELMREVAQLSKKHGILVHTHASENRKEIELVKKLTGLNNINYLNKIGMTSPRLVLAHCIWLSENEKKLLKKSHTNVTHCPSSNMKLASGFAPVVELQKMGINVALGADGAPCNNNLNMFQEMRMAALIHKPTHGPRAMRAQTVLDMATLNGAKALHWQNDIGSIEVGKKADLIALNLRSNDNSIADVEWNKKQGPSPEAIATSVVYSSSPAHVKATWVDGILRFSQGI